MAEETEKVEFEGFGAKIKTEARSLNTQLTFLIFVGIIGLAAGGVVLANLLKAHTEDAKEAQTQFVGAIKEQTLAVKEQTGAMRENNCLQAKVDPETCRRLSR